MLILLVLLISVQHAYSVSTCNRRNGQLPEHGMFWEDYIGEWTYLNTPSQSYASMEGYYITSAMEDKCADRCKNPPSLVDESFGGPVGWIYEEYNGGSRDYFAFAVEILVDSSGYYTSWKYYPICKCVHRDALNAISSSPDYSDYNNEPSNFIHSFYRWAYGFEVPHSPITCSAPIMHHIKDDNGDCPCYPGTYAPSCNIWTVCGSHEYEAVSPTSQRNRVCELKVCICSTGAATTGDQCPYHGDAVCLTDLIPWDFYEFKDNTYLSTTQDDIISFDLAPLYQSKEYQRQATVDVDNIQGEYTYYEISFDEPVSYNELTDKCSGFCGASELDMSDYYIKSSGYCTDDGHYIDTIEECKDAFSSTGTIVDEVNKFKISTFGRGKYCHDDTLRSARTFSGTYGDSIAEATEGSTPVDNSPSVQYNCYLSCLENYQNKDGTPFVLDDPYGAPPPYEYLGYRGCTGGSVSTSTQSTLEACAESCVNDPGFTYHATECICNSQDPEQCQLEDEYLLLHDLSNVIATKNHKTCDNMYELTSFSNSGDHVDCRNSCPSEGAYAFYIYGSTTRACYCAPDGTSETCNRDTRAGCFIKTKYNSQCTHKIYSTDECEAAARSFNLPDTAVGAGAVYKTNWLSGCYFAHNNLLYFNTAPNSIACGTDDNECLCTTHQEYVKTKQNSECDQPITAQADCEAAAWSFNLQDKTAEKVSRTDWLSGCYFAWNNQLYFNTATSNIPCGTDNNQCLCRKYRRQEYFGTCNNPITSDITTSKVYLKNEKKRYKTIEVEEINFFDEHISRSFYVRDSGRCYCLSHDTDHCNQNDIDLVSDSNIVNRYENYDIPTVPFCTIKDGDVFYKTPYTDMQRERECGEDGFNCLCRRKAEMKNILTPEKSRDPALHATFVGNGYCAGGVVNEMGVNCPDGELVEVDGVNKCQKPRNRLLGLDWKYTTDNGASRGHPIGQEECEQECVRRGCTAYSVSVALNKCRFSYDECTSLQGSEPDEIQVSEFSISGTEYIFPEVVHLKRFTMDVANEQDTDISVKVWDDEFYGCTTECIGNCNNPSYTFIPDGSYSVVAPVQEPPIDYSADRRRNNQGGFILLEQPWGGHWLRCWQNFRDENIYVPSTSGQYGTVGGYPVNSLSDCMNACQGSSEFFYYLNTRGPDSCICRNEPYTCSIDKNVNYALCPSNANTLCWQEGHNWQRYVIQPGTWESDTCQSCPGGLSWNMAMSADPIVTHNEVKEVICPVAGSSVRFGSSYTNIAIYRHPTWKTYKMDRNIVKVGNYTGELRLMETIWDEETPKCRCYASENELPIKVQETSSLFTVYTGEFVPTWDKSLFYKREHKNPFVCNYESYSEYGGITSDSCGCGDDIALAEMETTFSIGSRRSITYGGSDIPGDTLSDKLQYCAKSCRDKIFISATVTDELPVLVRTGQCRTSGNLAERSGLTFEGCAIHCMSNPNHKGFIFGGTSSTNCYCSTTDPKTCDRHNDNWNNYHIPIELRGSIHHNPEWLINNDADIITMMTTGPKTGECVCSSQSDVNSESATLDIEGYKSFKLRPGCSCAGTFILNHEKVMCPTGSFNAGSCQYECPQCPRGYYQSEEGRISCDKCPEGYFQDSVGKDSCKTCTNFCSGGGPKGSGTTSTCPPASIADTTSCSQCTGERHFIQQKSVFLTQGMKHAHGVYSPKLVYVDPGEVCINCPLGWFDSNNECTACPRGYYGLRGTTVCNACQAGTYQSKEGQTQCTNCDDGKYQPDEAQTTCMECSIGKAREAYFPHNGNIMKKQGLTQDCLTCGSTYPSSLKPGCIYCNQYQDEVGQKRCKRCPMNPNAQWQVYSHIDQNNNPYTKEGSCKYAENLNYWWERRRVVDPRPDGMRWGELEWCGEEYTDQPFSSQEEKKQFQNWTACVYASNTWTGIRYENHVLLEYEDWFGDYNFYKDAYTLQGYDEKCTREGYSDFYINNFLNLECNTTVAQLQYAAYGSEVPT